jgi:hypothetical protein
MATKQSKTKKKKKEQVTYDQGIAKTTEIEIARDPEIMYMGVCIVQAPGAWTRIGPTWHSARFGWLCAGVGVQYWQTNQGLGELAVNPDVKPAWHAAAVTWAPLPNLVFPLNEGVVDSHEPVVALIKEIKARGIKI